MRSERGQDLIEAALVLPLLLLLIFGIADGSLLIWRYNTIANAAREGARAAILPVTAACDQTCLDGKARSAALQLTTGLDPGALTVTVTRPNGETVQVTVAYNATLITAPVINALGGASVIALRSVATMERE